MKTFGLPSSGRCGSKVASRNHYGPFESEYVVPANPGTERQGRARGDFGELSIAWGTLLTERQRLAWIVAGAKVERRDSLGNLYTLTGQALFEGINSARACIGREMLLDPPEPAGFLPSPVAKLFMRPAGGRPRLELRVGEPVSGDIMVFGQEPCGQGRMRPRRGIYLGLVPSGEGSLRDISELYLAVHRAPRAGEKVFIWTRCQVNGWEGPDRVLSALLGAEAGTAGRGQGD